MANELSSSDLETLLSPLPIKTPTSGRKASQEVLSFLGEKIPE
jgi:hypothetical protein